MKDANRIMKDIKSIAEDTHTELVIQGANLDKIDKNMDEGKENVEQA